MGLYDSSVFRARIACAAGRMTLAAGAAVLLAGCADPLVVADDPKVNHPSIEMPAREGTGSPERAASDREALEAPAPTPPLPPLPSPPAPPGSGLVDAEVFGQPVRGLHPEFLRRLRLAEAKVQPQSTDLASENRLPLVETMVGYRPGSRAHSEGRAIDINYWANPYLMHESGEDELDRDLGPVYHRISRLMLGRDSVIPETITQGAPSPERAMRLYEELREESRGMMSYFRLMRDRALLSKHLETVRRRSSSPVLQELPGSSPEELQRQMMADYVTLTGRPGPPVEGLAYPAPAPVAGDRPFAGDAQFRGPDYGFMRLNPQLLRALLDARVRWGGTDMGNASGDIMHFYLTRDELQRGQGGQHGQ